MSRPICNTIQAIQHKTDIVIIGAGAAGIHAAYLLSNKGQSVTVLEASERLGGRIFSVPIEGGGAVELGAQWLGKSKQQRLETLAKRYDAKYQSNHYEGLTTHILRKTVVKSTSKMPPLSWFESLDVFQISLKINRLTKHINVESPWLSHVRLDKISFVDWVLQQAWTKSGAGYWNNLIEQSVCNNAKDLSVLEVLQNIASIGKTKTLLEADHYYFPSGLQRLFETYAKASGAKFLINSKVLTIIQCANELHVNDENGNVFVCNKVLIAAAPQVIPNITFNPPLPDTKLSLQSSMKEGQVVKVLAVYDSPWWREKGLSGLVFSPDASFDTVIDVSHSNLGILSALVTSDRCLELQKLSDVQLTCEFVLHIGDAFGEQVQPKAFYRYRWEQDPYIRGGYSSNRPIGAWQSGTSALSSPYGNIHFASTETATQWRGYIEGALESAERAVAEMI